MLQFRAVEWINLGNHRARKDHAQTESLWQKVAKTAAAESQYQPPPQAVRAVKTAFAMSGLAARRQETVGLIQLLYDSFLQPALVGISYGSIFPDRSAAGAESLCNHWTVGGPQSSGDGWPRCRGYHHGRPRKRRQNRDESVRRISRRSREFRRFGVHLRWPHRKTYRHFASRRAGSLGRCQGLAGHRRTNFAAGTLSLVEDLARKGNREIRRRRNLR